MTLDLNDLTVIYSEQAWIKLSQKEQEKAWQVCVRQPYSNDAARWTAYLNYLCLNTFTTWLKEAPDVQEMLNIWPRQAELPSFWEVVNGTGLTLGTTRLALIPSDKSNLQEFQIPQEWVDIPNWAANYYLAVQLNLEEGWLRVWGFATHQQIQKEGRYDPIDQTYSLDTEDLIEDLNILWVGQELCPVRKPEVISLPSLSSAQAEKLLEQLSKWTPYSPRLDIPFEEWAALLTSDENRQSLYQQRMENLPNKTAEDNLSLVNDLSQWFQNLFETGWQSIDELLALLGPEQRDLAVQFRGHSELHEFPINRAKLIDLEMQLGNQTIVLLVGIKPETDEKVSIRVRLHPASGEILPPNLKLILLSDSGTTLQEVKARSYDNYIQLKRFKSPSGNSFSIQVSLNDVRIKEDFVIEPLVGRQQ